MYAYVQVAARAGHEAAVLELLDAGADANAGAAHSKPLTAAVLSGHASLVKLLLKRGAKVTVGHKTAAEGLQSLLRAADQGKPNRAMVKLLHAVGEKMKEKRGAGEDADMRDARVDL